MVVAVIGGILFVLGGHKAIAKGLVLGTLFSVINFVLMGQVLPLIMSESRRRSVMFSMGSILIRFLLLSIPLVVALKLESLSFTAAVVGVFMVQIVILLEHFIQLIKPGNIQQV